MRKYCSSCGNELNKDGICEKCGTYIEEVKNDNKMYIGTEKVTSVFEIGRGIYELVFGFIFASIPFGLMMGEKSNVKYFLLLFVIIGSLVSIKGIVDLYYAIKNKKFNNMSGEEQQNSVKNYEDLGKKQEASNKMIGKLMVGVFLAFWFGFTGFAAYEIFKQDSSNILMPVVIIGIFWSVGLYIAYTEFIKKK